MSVAQPRDLVDRLIEDWKRERPNTEPDAMHVVGRIIRLARIYEEDATRMLRDHHLSYSDFDVIATLRRSGAPHELMPTQLQKSVLLSSGAMTACLRRLESAGLISREAGRQDRRRLSAKLTARGFDLVEKLIDQRFDIARKSATGLSATQFATVTNLLRKLGS